MSVMVLRCGQACVGVHVCVCVCKCVSVSVCVCVMRGTKVR